MLQVTAAGRLGKDGELRTTQKGESVLGFSVGTDVGYGDNKKTVWLECSVWGTRAEKLAPYLLKGASVTVTGAADMRFWESNGKSGTSLTCRVSEVTLQGGKRDDGQQRQDSQSRSSGGGSSGWEPGADMDDEIPF